MTKLKQRKLTQFDFHPVVFSVSALLILIFIVITLAYHDQMLGVFTKIQESISDGAGWFFVLCVNLFLVFSIYLAFGPFAKLKLGGKDDKPEFSTLGWFSMLFSAGMGIGLLFWSVAEPIYHFSNQPIVQDTDARAANEAMGFTFLHWGLHAWGIYAMVGLALGYFAFNMKLPLSIRSVFYPMLGEKIHGPIGNFIDILAVLATLFGLATSLGFGAQQINAGLHYLFGVEISVTIQILLISAITGMATTSVVLGLDGGVRRLSELNVRLAGLMLLAVLILGPTLFILDSFVQNIGYYVQHLPELSYWTEAYQQTTWQNDWTIFYWAWWIAWSPFVGMFIARISKGRTVREFVLGVLLVPSLITFFWISVFGGSAIFLELAGDAKIAALVNEDVATSLFVLLEHFPFSFISSLLGVLLIISFFVTSSDSGSLVIDSITAGGKLDAPVGQRIFWAVTEGAVAAILLLGGGLQALQTVTITTGLPFAVVLLLMCFNLFKAMRKELKQKKLEKLT